MAQLKSFLVPLLLLGGIGIIIYSASNKSSYEESQDSIDNRASVPKLPAELLSCNDVTSAETTEAFETCLELAEQGYADAQRKVAWAYTREGEYQDWQQAFNWLKKVAQFDMDIKLLSQIVLFLLGESEEDKIKAENNIRQLADVRFAPAEAYLATMYYLNINILPRDANPAWLLRKAYDQDKSMISPYEMAAVYVNGFGTRQNVSKAKKVLVDYANDEFPFAANNVAWFLATLENNTITKPNFAIELAQSAINDPEDGNRYTFVDTLAASYAADGDFERAIDTQQKAIEMLNLEIAEARESEEEIEEFEERLALYQKGERPILESFDVEIDVFFQNLKRDIERILLNGLNVIVDSDDVTSESESTEAPDQVETSL